MIKLRANHSYCFTKEDYQFIIELAKVGHVNLLSHQVTLFSDKGLSFKEYNSDGSCKGLTLPDNWVIEGIYPKNENSLSITFGVSNKENDQ